MKKVVSTIRFNLIVQSEDDGVVLSSLIWGGAGNECRSGLLVLDARTWTELGRTEFRTPSPVVKCLHGWFLDGIVQPKEKDSL